MTVDDGSLDDIEAFIESSFYNAVLNSPMTAKEESDSELGEVHAIDVSFDAPTEGVPGRQGNGNDKESTPVIFPPPPGNGKGEKSKAVVPSSRSDRAGPEKRDNRGSKNQEGGYFGKDRMTLLLQIYSLQTELRKVKTGEVASGAGSPGS